MKKHLLFLLCLIIYSVGLAQTVKDVNGNAYNTVKIGSQIWMAENLKVVNYQNGDPLINLVTITDWTNSKKSGYCYYNNDTANSNYGLIYKYNVIYDKRKICPVGWKVPSLNDMKILSDYFGGNEIKDNEVAVIKLKSSSEWTNTFNAGSFGFRASSGYFFGIGINANYWISDVNKLPSLLFLSDIHKKYDIRSVFGMPGYYIRCIKEN